MLTLVLPGLLLGNRGFDPAQGLALPALAALLGRASRRVESCDGAHAWLAGQFAFNDASLAELTARFDMPDASGLWWRVDPVHLRVDRDRAVLFDAGMLRLRLDEAQGMVARLNQQFASDGLQFVAPVADRWYVQFSQPLALHTSPLHRAFGQDVRDHLPKGPDALLWHKLHNEMQMLLYTDPVNEARELAGALTANSLWLWGEGTPLGRLAAPWPQIWADEVLPASLARAAGQHCAPLPAAFAAEMAQGMVWQDALAASARYGDIDAWRAGLQRLERDWFAPLWQAWRSGQLPALTVILPGASSLLTATLGPAERWRFWRRSLPLATFLQGN
ncbi:hypothetical protein [Chitinimonas sp.]|uniref:hypothetical protein n=1 Tax=Chitinimonas sp. TaxID=1934313 RepID=UPI0035B10DF6